MAEEFDPKAPIDYAAIAIKLPNKQGINAIRRIFSSLRIEKYGELITALQQKDLRNPQYHRRYGRKCHAILLDHLRERGARGLETVMKPLYS